MVYYWYSPTGGPEGLKVGILVYYGSPGVKVGILEYWPIYQLSIYTKPNWYINIYNIPVSYTHLTLPTTPYV